MNHITTHLIRTPQVYKQWGYHVYQVDHFYAIHLSGQDLNTAWHQVWLGWRVKVKSEGLKLRVKVKVKGEGLKLRVKG